MQMWPSILSLLESAQDPVIAHACWICGTAIQNNDKAQQAVSDHFPHCDCGKRNLTILNQSCPQFLTHNPLPRIYSLISSVHPTNSSVTISPQTRAKAVYALSAALKHNPQALSSLNKESRRGWGVLRQGLRDPEGTIRRKIAFLIGTLIMQSGEGANGSSSSGEMVAALKENGLTEALMSSLTDPLPLGPDGSEEPDHDLLEKSFRALVGIAEKDGLSVEQKSSLSNVITRWGKEEGGWDQVGLSDSEAKDALNLLSK
jgi:hsp70-interacting protein